MSPKRLYIDTKEVACLLGRSIQIARKDLAKCCDHFQKPKGSDITYQQYADYKGIPVEQVFQILFPNS